MSSPAEHAFCEQVITLGQKLGALAHWCRDSRRCAGQRGCPDILLIGNLGLILAECKMPDSETSAEQDLWAWTIYQAISSFPLGSRVSYRVWFPMDLGNGAIKSEISRIVRK